MSAGPVIVAMSPVVPAVVSSVACLVFFAGGFALARGMARASRAMERDEWPDGLFEEPRRDQSSGNAMPSK